MQNEPHTHGAGSGPGYETQDASPRSLLVPVVALAATIIGVALLMVVMFHYMAGAISEGKPASVLSGAQQRILPPEPRLQPNPKLDLERVQEQGKAALDRYAWVDPRAGVVQIPIDRAIDRLLEKGLPVQTEQAGKK